MNKLPIENYLQTTRNYFGPIAVVIVLLALIITIYIPYIGKIGSDGDQITSSEAKLEQLQTKSNIINAHYKSLNTLDTDVLLVKNAIPPVTQIPETGQLLENMATQSGFTLNVLSAHNNGASAQQPVTTVVKDKTTGLEMVEYEFHFIGDRNAFKSFTQKVAASPRLFTISSVAVKGAIDGLATGGAQYTIDVNSYDLDPTKLTGSTNAYTAIPSSLDQKTLSKLLSVSQQGNQ